MSSSAAAQWKSLAPRFRTVLRTYGIASGAVAVCVLALLATPGVKNPSSREQVPNATGKTPRAVTPHFRDTTLDAGLVFTHLQGDEHLTGINETLGAGACAFDYDGDGWVDLYLVNGTGQTRYYGAQHWWHLPKGNALYRNVGGRFEDATDASGLRSQTWGMGCAAGDFDNDGDSDLLLTNFGSLKLYRNDNGHFTDVTVDSKLSSQLWATSAALGDYDGDGLLDIYVANYVDFAKGANTYEGNTQYIREFSRAFSPLLYVGVADRLYRNTGGLRFDDVTEQAGVSDASGRTLSAAWLDVDEDRRPDLLVANDSGTTNLFYSNRGRGKFEETGLRYLLNDAHGSHGLSIGDVNSDGMLDVAVSTVAGEPPILLMNEAMEDRESRVFRNRSRQLGLAVDDESAAGGWGIELADFNNDGRLDLFQANGLLAPDPDTHKVPQGQPKRLWIQEMDGRFRDASVTAGSALLDAQSARGIAVADFDNDGRLDIYVAHNNDLGQLLHNETDQAHWLGVQLHGRRSNRDAIGTRVELRCGSSRQYRVVTSGGFLSGSDRRVHFGLGADTCAAEMRVIWPDGSKQTFRNLPVDRYVTLEQGRSSLIERQTEIPPQQNVHAGLRVGGDRPEYRLHYLRWVATQESPTPADQNRIIAELRNALRDSDVRMRLLAIELLAKRKSADGLTVLVSALEDADPQVRIAAVNAVQQHEDEASMRWLLRLFRDPEPSVRVALAEAFAFFYRKEEAVVYRKYLALPHLIRMTSDEDKAVRRAAARAIGEAKRYEGIDPLLTLIGDPEESVGAEAVCSLGLIRDRRALATLQRVAQEPETLPLVRAHSLIALQRLNSLPKQDLRRLVESGLRSDDSRKMQRTLQMLDEIFGNPMHGVVLDRGLLTEALLGSVGSRSGMDVAMRRKIVATLRLAASGRTIPLLMRYTQDSDPTVREAAYMALLSVDRASRAVHYKRALSDPAIELRIQMLRELQHDEVELPAQAVLPNLKNPQTRSLAIKVVRDPRDKATLLELARIAADVHEPISVRVAAMEILANAGPSASPVPQSLLTENVPDIRAGALRWWGAQLPFYLPRPEIPQVLQHALRDPERVVGNAAIEVLQTRHEAWAVQYLQLTALELKADVGVRRRILDGFSAANTAQAHEVMLAVAGRRNDPLRYPAVNLLAAADADARRLLWKILKDRAEDADLRFAAAMRLEATDGRAVIETLRAG